MLNRLRHRRALRGLLKQNSESLAGRIAYHSECYFWATQNKAELDLLVVRGRHRFGFEFKKTSSPTGTPSMRIAMQDLRLASLDVLYPGKETYPLTKGIRAVGISNIESNLTGL